MRLVFQQIVWPAAQRFQPDVILVSAGGYGCSSPFICCSSYAHVWLVLGEATWCRSIVPWECQNIPRPGLVGLVGQTTPTGGPAFR